MKRVRPSRTLNEKSVLLGLDFADVVGLACLLIVLQVVLKPFRLEFFALVGTGVVAALLMPLRLKFRRKIIRDTIKRFMGPKVMHVPRGNRSNPD